MENTDPTFLAESFFKVGMITCISSKLKKELTFERINNRA